MKRFAAATIAILAGLVFSVSPVLAQGNIKMGKITVIPSLTLQETYDDNIFLGSGDNSTTEDEVDDLVTDIQPGILLNYDITGRGFARFGVDGDVALYADNSDNNWQNVNFLGQLQYNAPAGLYLKLRDNYTDAEDPYGSQSQYNLGVQTKRWFNNLSGTLGYELQQRYRMEAYVGHYKQDYDEDIDFTQDFSNYEVGAGAAYRLMPKMWGFARYRYGDQDYYTHPAGSGSTDANDADHNWHRINLGLSWEASPKLNGELNVGYKWISHDNAFDVNGAAYEDPDGLIAGTRLVFTPTGRTELVFRLDRAFRYTDSTIREYFEDTGVAVDLSQEFLFDFVFKAGLAYNLNDYNTNDREDDIFKAKLGVDYIIQPWLTAGFIYNYEVKDSSSNSAGDNQGADNEYDVNRFGIFLKATY